jgi:hypothetical protein
MSTILAEVPTVGQAIRNIVNHFIDPLILLASVFFVGAAMFFRWKERSSDNLVGSWIEIESSTEEEDSDAEVLE